MKTGSYYERTLESIWRRVLKSSPSGSRVLDVGANIGYFGLVSLAASEGVVVDAFEPNPVNFLRTCESLALNNWTLDNVNGDSPGLHIHPVGVSDTNEILPFLTNKGNPGQSQFAANLLEARALIEKSQGSFVHGTNKSVITLDAFAMSRQWLQPDDEGEPISDAAAPPAPPHIAILKVDVEALEHKVIHGATRLLRTHTVKNVFMEVSARNEEEASNGRRAAEALLQAGYKLRGHGGFSGPGSLVSWPQDDPQALVKHILREAKKLKQINLWWTV
jgi:FkbM family methyltransferase